MIRNGRETVDELLDIGLRLRRAREALNVTIEQLSQRTGISKTALSAYERGTRMPDPAGWDSDGSKLCNELQIGMDYLYRGDERWVISGGRLSDKVAQWRKLESHVKEAAKRRMLAGTTAEADKGRAADRLAKMVGKGTRTMLKAVAIVEAAERDPKKYGKLVEEMDRNGADGAYKKLREMQAAERTRGRMVG